MTNQPAANEPIGVAGLVIGGIADGLVVKGVDPNRTHIALSRPDHMKPLASADQTAPEVVTEDQVYSIQPIQLTDNPDDNQVKIYALLVPEGVMLSEAFEALLVNYVEKATEQLQEDSSPTTHH